MQPVKMSVPTNRMIAKDVLFMILWFCPGVDHRAAPACVPILTDNLQPIAALVLCPKMKRNHLRLTWLGWF